MDGKFFFSLVSAYCMLGVVVMLFHWGATITLQDIELTVVTLATAIIFSIWSLEVKMGKSVVDQK